LHDSISIYSFDNEDEHIRTNLDEMTTEDMVIEAKSLSLVSFEDANLEMVDS